MYELRISKKAGKYIQSLDKPTRERIFRALIELSENPFIGPNVKRLRGYLNTYRKRIGDYRVIYEIDEGRLLVLVLKVGSRGDIYK